MEPLPKDYASSDPELIQLIRKKFLIPPSTQNYNLENNIGFDTSMGQAEAVRRILNDQVIFRVSQNPKKVQFRAAGLVCPNRKNSF